MDEQKNIRIIFTEKAYSILSGIMEKYNLEENDAQTLKKVQEKKPFNVVVLNRLTKNFVKGTISEKEFISLLQKDLDAPQQTAGKILNDIINDIIPLLKKIPEEELKKQPYIEQEPEPSQIPEEPNKPDFLTKIKPPIGVEQALKKEETIKEESYKKPPPLNTEVKKTEVTKKPFRKNKEIEKPKDFTITQPKKQDTYREPVE